MHSLRYLPLARSDIRDALLYIAEELKNPEAALSLMDKLEKAILQLKEFPYAHPLYHAPMRLPSETRFVPVESYLVFYTVLEPEHIVEVRRVLYDKMDFRKQPL
jgi:plasmid stabilization system protein ParE